MVAAVKGSLCDEDLPKRQLVLTSVLARLRSGISVSRGSTLASY